MLIQTYTSDWITDFEQLKQELDSVLNGIDCYIEHIGSTAVPNLDSKPIIDIDIIYNRGSDFNAIKANLEKLGYYHNGNQGIEERNVFKRHETSTNPILDTITHHLYVCPKTSKALERHILFRDYLRKNDWARQEYQNLKYELAQLANQDKKRYAQLKELNINTFVDSIIEKEKMKR